jgi:hypothetical protein
VVVVWIGLRSRLRTAQRRALITRNPSFDRRHRALVRFLAFACAVAAILAPGAAWAYAPMCDENAQTIDAPAPIYPSKAGTISAVSDCQPDRTQLGSVPRPDPHRTPLSAEAIDRALASGTKIPPCAKSARLTLELRELGRALPARGGDVFRPPRA